MGYDAKLGRVLKNRDKILFGLLFLFFLFVSLNRHSKHPAFDYHSELFTDKAGYHVYLPAFFYYGMDGQQMPAGIDIKTGTGFRIEEHKIITKYPIGVALMEAPFFALAAAIDHRKGVEKLKGYTTTHHKILSFSGAFYGTVGLLVFFVIGRRFWGLDATRAYLLTFMVLGCSNLLYYITRDPGMSHLYSFMIFAGLLHVFYDSVQRKLVSQWKIILLLFLLCMVVALRPLNLVFISFPIAYLLFQFRKDLPKLTFVKPLIGLVIGIPIALVPIALQLAYNKYAYGNLLADSYAGETFNRWNKLHLLEFWFGANNGVLVYIPILLLVFVWVLNQLQKKDYKALLFIGYFLAITITYAAWWSPTLGCGFGHRGFTEHLAFFALPMSGLLRFWKPSVIKITWVVSVLIFVLLFIAQYNFDDCWRGDGAWDWVEFFRLFKL